MNMYRKNRPAGWKRQKGMTLMELLVAGTISVIVSSGMVILMASTLGTGTETIKMTKLSSEMRSAMQIMTRELRRANYHATFASCFGDQNCLTTLGIANQVTEINVNDTNDCFWFFYDRPQRGTTQDAITDDTIAAFRFTTTADPAIGIIQMAIGISPTTLPGVNECPGVSVVPEDDWVDITNSDLIDVTAFNVTDAVTNFASYTYTVNGTQSIERIGVTMSGRLRIDDASLPDWMQDDANAPLLTIRDFVRVRNDIFRP